MQLGFDALHMQLEIAIKLPSVLKVA